MVRQTPHHGWDVMEASDENYTEIFDELIDDIDDAVIETGTISERPEAARAGRMYVTTDESPPLLYLDDGTQWVGIKGALNVPDNVAETDANETISGQWEFLQEIDASISGEAQSANNADEAETAQNGVRIQGEEPDIYTRNDENENISGEWTFESTVTLQDGLDAQSGTINLPVYNGSDPNSPPTGAMWFREDQQPTN